MKNSDISIKATKIRKKYTSSTIKKYLTHIHVDEMEFVCFVKKKNYSLHYCSLTKPVEI